MILEIYLAGALGILALIGHKQSQQSQDTKIVDVSNEWNTQSLGKPSTYLLVAQE